MIRKALSGMFMLVILLSISGCSVVYKDASGNPAPQRVDFDCKQKCGYYDTNMSPVGTAFCLRDCMASNGYPYQ